MVSDLIVLHKKGHWWPNLETAPWIHWKTCLREMLIGHHQWMQNGQFPQDIQVYKGEKAYQFLLEIVCGLHSPLVGETEVLGQYKELISQSKGSQLPWRQELIRTLKMVLTDAKQIRKTHLQGLGSQTYGSLCRKKLKSCHRISLLGVGQLGQEILPWLSKMNAKVEVFTRDPNKYSDLISHFSDIHFRKYEDIDIQKDHGIVIAAPLKGEFIEKIISDPSRVSMVIDLRGESRDDPLNGKWPVINLKSFFSEIDSQKGVIKRRVDLAQESIGKRIVEVNQSVRHRPFGWDDLWA